MAKSKTVVGGAKTKVLNAVKLIVLSLVLLLYMVPFFLILVNSFKRKITIIKHPLMLIDPKGFSVENYVSAFKEMNYLRAFGNSLIITTVSVLFIVLFASMASYYMARSKTIASRLSFSLIVAAMVIPFQTIMIPLISIYGNMFGMLNMRSTLIFMNIGFGMALAIFIYYGFIRSGVPVSLEEAAIIDGCRPYQVFFKIVFPLLKPTTATLIVLDVLWLWNDYLLPSLILGKKALYTLPLSTYTFYGTYSNDLGKIMAGLVLTILPVIAIYLLLQKQIISGVVAGAVKS
ncbi:MAG: carbohydrate ABC transporter permease [Lachnospiraceae bacterium]|nr:carbohydrate ABC transporter permease [Lachnospiraceae bacterium]